MTWTLVYDIIELRNNQRYHRAGITNRTKFLISPGFHLAAKRNAVERAIKWKFGILLNKENYL